MKREKYCIHSQSFVGIQDSNEAKILSILEALRIFCSLYQQLLILESDSSNAISWVTSFNFPWTLQIYFNEIRHLASRSQVSFQHISKQGVDRSCNLDAYVM